jgi:predicted flap endonuclease-1-like 5' DNA nuclease
MIHSPRVPDAPPSRPADPSRLVNGLTLLVLIALAIGIVVAWRAGKIAGRREARGPEPMRPAFARIDAKDAGAPGSSSASDGTAARTDASPVAGAASVDDERYRLVLALEAERANLAGALAGRDADLARLAAFAEERRALIAELAETRGEIARYRALIVEVEANAPPLLLGGPGSHDDLKLIVGIGPMLERMLAQLGVTSYRQIGRWTERDIDEFDRRLPEFPGRIRRDQWVVQARALHQSKYGSPP